MLMNGIDYTARENAMVAAGIDPDGLLAEYERILGATYAYCGQHLNIHSTASGCTVGLVEQFPLKATTIEEAREEVRARGFALHLEATTCAGCGEKIIQNPGNGLRWTTVEASEDSETDRTRCSNAHNMYGTHTPVPSIPRSESASL